MRQGLTEWQAARVRRYIEEHIGETIRVCDLGRMLRLSSTHFNRLFRRTFGLAPYAYIMRRRTIRAAEIMLQGDLPLSAVTQLCGFFDQAHFTRVFRRLYGQSPSAWRREQLHRESAHG